MPISNKIKHIYEPDNLQCGQAVIAMLAQKEVEEVISVVGTKRETTLNQMFNAFDFCILRAKAFNSKANRNRRRRCYKNAVFGL